MTQPANSLVQCYSSEISEILKGFSETDNSGKLALQQLLLSDAHAFRAAAINCLRGATPTAGFRYLVHLLMNERILVSTIADPALSTSADAIAIATAVTRVGVALESEIVHFLGPVLKRGGDNIAVVLRLLEILKALSAEEHVMLLQDDLTAHTDERVRSKAAYLLVLASKSPMRVSKALLQKDSRVQANAVEALSDLRNPEYRPIFRMAVTSPNNRVAGNAAIGLYRIADLESITQIFHMAEHDDPAFRITGIWAMGETADPRFLPYLSREFETADGKFRLAVVRALARIRRREKSIRDAGELIIAPLATSLGAGGRGRLEFAISSSVSAEVKNLQCLDFVINTDGVQLTNYTVRASRNPQVLVIGFVLPRIPSTSDPYALGIRSALGKCLERKREADLWRIERYIHNEPIEEEPEPSKAPPAVLDAAAARQKQRWGFLHQTDSIGTAINEFGAKDKSARNAQDAVGRIAEGMDHLSGVRHLFVFADSRVPDVNEQQEISKLEQLARTGRIALHGFAIAEGHGHGALQDVCLKSDSGSFDAVPIESLESAVVKAYSRLLNIYEIKYSLPPTSPAPSDILLQIYCSSGYGETHFAVDSAKPS